MGVKQHRPIRLTLEFQGQQCKALQTKQIRGIPETQPLDGSDREEAVDRLLQEFLLKYTAAWEQRDVDRMWSLWSEVAEDFLLEQAAVMGTEADILQDQRYRGRGQAATVSTVRLGLQHTDLEGNTLDEDHRGMVKLQALLFELQHLFSNSNEVSAVCSDAD